MTTGRTSRLWLRPRNVNRLRPTRPIRTRLSLSPLEDRAVPAILTVTDAGDTGPNTLRGIMATADTNGEADTIQFGGGITTINLTSGEIGYTTDVNNLTINGAGVTVNGDAVAAATNRIFKFNVAGGDPTITINGLTMSAGNLTSGNNGGAILANNDPLVLDGATFSGNKTAGTGGAISLGALTTLTVTNCTFSSNTSTGAGGAIVSSTGASTITVTGSTFTGNKGSTGGVITASASLTVVNLTSSTFTSNTSTSSGGVLYAAVQSTWQIDQCQFVNNAATGVGGAIRMTSTSPTFNVNNSTFSGNTCTTNGGAIYFAGSSANPVTINNSTFSNNTAGTSGGAFHIPGSTTYTFNNCTLSGNTANGNTTASGGGAINVTSTIGLVINNSTIVNNTATGLSVGGGIRRGTATGTTTIISSIVAQNTGGGGADMNFSGPVTVNGGANLVGVADAGNFTLDTSAGSNFTGTAGSPLNPLIGPLQDNGGVLLPHTFTHLLLAGSPGVNTGNQNGLGTDQIGGARPPTGADIGAVESNPSGPIAPTAKSAPADVTTPGATSFTVDVIYSDDIGINTASIDVNDITISAAPFGGSPVSPSKASFVGGGTSVTATYTFTPPGGSWDALDNGKYTVAMVANQVFDTDAVAVFAGTLGTFNVSIPLPPLVVDNDGDLDDGKYGAGELTLREAIGLANGSVGTTDSISFAAALNGKTITVGSELKISDPVVITGPGANQLTLDSGGASNVRAFNIDMGTAGDAVSISGLTVQNFSVTGDGGGINNQDANLTLTGMVLKNNTASTDGGGINMELTGVALTMINSVLDGNIATSGDGAGLNVEVNATVTISNSAIRNNSASSTGGDGAGIMTVGTATTLTIEGSTISGNIANHSSSLFGGGGVYFNGTGTMTLTNSTVANNQSAGGGGGLHIDDAGTLNINNSTIVGNTAAFNGGGINLRSGASIATLVSTIVAGNTGATGPDVFGNASAIVNVEASNLGNSTGITTLNQTGTNFLDVDPLVAALGNNGGFALPDGSIIETVALQPGSPVVNQGVNPLSLSFDQRGTGFVRSFGPTDIGAFELKTNIPSGKATAPDVPPAFATVTVTVDYQDDVGINTSSIDTNDVTLSGPAFASPIAPISASFAGSGTNVTATYTFNSPGGGWQWFHNGKYSVAVVANQVFDTDGPNAVPAGNIGSFKVAQPLPATLTVDNDGDTDDGKYTAGELTLREAVNLANSEVGTANVIAFAAGMNGKTINLGGVLDVSDPLTINGPGAANLAVAGGGVTRLFDVNVAGAGGDVSISGLTLVSGNATIGTGGAMVIADESVTLNGMVFSGNTITGTGGAIGITGTATVTINNSEFSSNTSSSTGGAINASSTVTLNIADSKFTGNQGTTGGAIRVVGSTSTVTIDRSTLSGNISSSSGGALYISASTLTVGYSTFSGNTAGSSGGAVGMTSTTATFTNSTISGNIANGTGTTGGGGLSITTGNLTLNNSTVTGNSAPTGAGGGIRKTSVTGAVTLSSTILAANTSSTGGADFNLTVAGPINIGGGDNVVGVADVGNFTLTGTNATGTAGLPLDPLLVALASNGGPTQTHALMPGSPAFNTGNNLLGLTNDQRGPGFTRLAGAGVDAGAYEGVSVIPSAKATAPSVPPALSTVTVTVVYADETGINTSGIDVNDVRITGPAFGTPAVPTSASFTGSGTSVTATYTFNAPLGGWVATQNGTYLIDMQANEVFDTDGPNAVLPGTIGSFKVSIPALYTVDEASDIDDGNTGKGFLSLREAIGLANADVNTVDSITFDAGVFAGATTITMGGTEMGITGPVTINGPAAALTFDAGTLSRVFNVDGAGSIVVEITDLTLANGSPTSTLNGGNIFVANEQLTLRRMVITGGDAFNGGGISMNTAGGKLFVYDSKIINNVISTGDFDGGGINVEAAIDVVIVRSVISGNSADDDGGGIYFNNGGTLLMEDSTVSGNTATTANGGGIRLDGAMTSIIIRNSTISGNTATGSGTTGQGGGLFLESTFAGTLDIQNSTVAFNTSAVNGGGFSRNGTGGTVSLVSTIVSNNTSPLGADVNGAINADFSLLSASAGATITGANNVLDQDPLLGALGANGGPTETHALQALSPAINAGSNPAALANDQRGAGFARTSGGGTDIGAFEIQGAATPPTVSKLTVNTGANQRSMVTSFKVTFSEAVTFPSGIGAAFQLVRTGPGAPTGAVNISAVQSGSDVTITFLAGGAVGIDKAGSLLDGVYELTIVASNVQGAGGNLDGDGNGTGGDNYVTPTAPGSPGRLHRLFGDNDGDADVDAQDFGAFRAAFGTPSVTFDYDGDGDVDAQDFGQFRARFGSSV